MTGSHGALRRAGLCGALALVALLWFAGDAHAARYAIAQCGWHIGRDAEWSDTSGDKFRQDAYCVTPDGQDPFDGVHMKSITRDAAAGVAGTRLARWRWEAPPGTGITAVRGTWWHALHDGLEHRLGAPDGSGGFDVVRAADATDTTPTQFSAGFSPPRNAFESRLLCARGTERACLFDSPSFSSVRALTITLEDGFTPVAAMAGQILDPGWRRGTQTLNFGAADVGSGVRYTQNFVDGSIVGTTDYPCGQVTIGGEVRGTRMMPCGGGGLGVQSIATGQFSDGPHTLRTCVTDFAGNVGCSDPRPLLVDNTAPAAPRGLAVGGGDSWHPTNGFDLSWTNPGQGAASLIAGASYRITSFDGYDSGVTYVAGDGITSLGGLTVPRAGAYAVQIWLRDAAGNEDAGNSALGILRFDDVAPTVAFRSEREVGRPENVRAQVADAPSGVAAGSIEFRRIGEQPWRSLDTAVVRAQDGGGLDLLAHFRSDAVTPGTYEFRAEVADAAGNTAATTLRSDGTRMSLRAPLKPQTRLVARLRIAKRRGEHLTARFGTRAGVDGRLVDADGRGLAGERLSVVVRPARGAFAKPAVRAVRTGPRGGFHLALAAGTSRRINVRFAGSEALSAAPTQSLALRVRGGVKLRAAPTDLRNGQTVRLSGGVMTRGAPIPRRGKLIAIEYLESQGRHWRPVLVTRTDRSGHFRTRYRFHYISGTARIRLRATALPEDGWPYASGYARPVTVRVRG